MLYSQNQLKTEMNYLQLSIAADRYSHILYHSPKKFHKLKAHEKDFFFTWIWIKRNENGDFLYDLYNIEEAKEFLFHKIIQTYNESFFTFEGVFSNSMGLISKDQVLRDKLFFNTNFQEWKLKLDEHKGPYLSVLKKELQETLDEQKSIFGNQDKYQSQERNCYAIFFHI